MSQDQEHEVYVAREPYFTYDPEVRLIGVGGTRVRRCGKVVRGRGARVVDWWAERQRRAWARYCALHDLAA